MPANLNCPRDSNANEGSSSDYHSRQSNFNELTLKAIEDLSIGASDKPGARFTSKRLPFHKIITEQEFNEPKTNLPHHLTPISKGP